MIYDLKNNFLHLKINSEHAELESLVFKNKEYIYQKDLSWKKSWPICFPWAGLLLNNSYLYKDQKYKLQRHGFFRDIKNWKIIKQSSNKIIFKYTHSKEFINQYPFKFKIYVSYQIKKNNLLNKVKIKNNNNKIMYYGFGWHPAFILNKENGRITLEKNTKLHYIPEDGYLNKKMDTKLIKIFKIKEFSFAKSNSYIVLNNHNFEIIVNDNERKFKINTSKYKNIIFWKPSDKDEFLCIEPWASHSDFKNKNANDSISLNEKNQVLKIKKYRNANHELLIEFLK